MRTNNTEPQECQVSTFLPIFFFSHFFFIPVHLSCFSLQFLFPLFTHLCQFDIDLHMYENERESNRKNQQCRQMSMFKLYLEKPKKQSRLKSIVRINLTHRNRTHR